MWEAVLDRTGRAFGFHYNIIGIQHDFAAWNGFVPRTGYVQPSVSNRFTLYGRPGSVFERFSQVPPGNRIDPGATAFTRIAYFARSMAISLVSPESAAFAAALGALDAYCSP